MRAVVFHGHHDIRIENIPEPVPGPGQVAVRVAHNGLCGSDLHEYQVGPLVIPTRPHPLTGATLPQVLGHEFAGTVVGVGSGVSGLTEGDRVCVEPIYRCDECAPCRAGNYNLCRKIAFHGLMAHGGGMSEVTVLPARTLHRLPDSVSLELGALVEPMAVAMRAARRGNPKPGDQTVVFGAGPIGIGTWFALRALGIDDIVVVEPKPARRAAIAALGATVVDPAANKPLDFLMTHTGGRGVDVAYDAAGEAASILNSISAVRSHGSVVSVALYTERIPFNPNKLLHSEATWTGSLAYTGEDYGRVIELMETGHYATDGWVSHISMDDVVSGGFEAMEAGTVVKVLVDL